MGAGTQRQYGGVSGGYQSGYAKWSNSLDGVHGNSLSASGPHDVYVIRDAKSRELLYFGETGRDYLTRFTEHQRVFAKKDIALDVDLLRTAEGKKNAKELELKYIQTYTKTFGKRPPYNPVNH
ncbi:hypothetical protein D9M09_10680 [Janthinobacterium agaricidamnosum]|uniref:GIY-YIG domain-containing protein n=2 Tax=Oxalobacteraceae TaxID=75682 RepID=A0A3G2E9N8_9BURK|nr:hypothetical protein D9M09_10680 [Janthinobacterium agaricidamnosum]